MTNQKRMRGMISLGVAVVAIVILSAGLSEVKLLPGESFFIEAERAGVEGGFGPLPAGRVVIILLRAIVSLIVLLLPVILVYAIISPEFRRHLLRRLVSFLLFAVVLYQLTRTWPELFNLTEGATLLGAPDPDGALLGATPVQFVADPPAWLVLAASLGLALLASALLVGAVWFLRHRRQRPAGYLEQLADEAEEALGLLWAGGDLKDTVIRCYAEMSHTLDRERGILRQGSMTPREFEDRLVGVGLPGRPVRQLTRLFERVRYGAKAADEREEAEALACLTAIVEACRAL